MGDAVIANMKYFAYGSNMDPAQMIERLKSEILPRAAAASLKGYCLCFNKKKRDKHGVGYANIIPNVGSVVYGMLYDLTEKDLRKLDEYEPGYERGDVKVTSCKEYVSAVTYIACKVNDGLRPECKYIKHLLAGRKYLPDDYFDFLIKEPVFEDKEK